MNGMFPLMALAGISFWGAVLYLALRFVRAAERRGASRGELDELRSRVTQLEEDLLVAQTEMQRLVVAERFNAQLLANRPAAVPATAASSNS